MLFLPSVAPSTIMNYWENDAATVATTYHHSPAHSQFCKESITWMSVSPSHVDNGDNKIALLSGTVVTSCSTPISTYGGHHNSSVYGQQQSLGTSYYDINDHNKNNSPVRTLSHFPEQHKVTTIRTTSPLSSLDEENSNTKSGTNFLSHFPEHLMATATPSSKNDIAIEERYQPQQYESESRSIGGRFHYPFDVESIYNSTTNHLKNSVPSSKHLTAFITTTSVTAREHFDSEKITVNKYNDKNENHGKFVELNNNNNNNGSDLETDEEKTGCIQYCRQQSDRNFVRKKIDSSSNIDSVACPDKCDKNAGKESLFVFYILFRIMCSSQTKRY